MRFLTSLLVAALLLIAAPAFAAPNAWTDCSGSAPWSPPDNTNISTGDHVCFEYDENHGTTDIWFEVTAPVGNVCAILDTQSAITGDTRFNIRACPLAVTPSLNVCKDIVVTVTTAFCEAVSTGRYLVNITTPVTATEDAAISIKGRAAH